MFLRIGKKKKNNFPPHIIIYLLTLSLITTIIIPHTQTNGAEPVRINEINYNLHKSTSDKIESQSISRHLDNDSLYDNDYNPETSHVWHVSEQYQICPRIDDSNNTETVDTASVLIFEGELQADAGGPYQGMITIPVLLNGSATGGESPYIFNWNLDNDTEFDDATGAATNWTWNTTGVYTIALCVTDAGLNESINTTTVIIIKDPLIANAGGPYTGSVNAFIAFNGSATGGLKPYTFYWELTNDSLYDDATGANITYRWNNRGTYPISLKVVDIIGNEAIDNTTVTVVGASVTITKPLPNTMYLWNIPLPRITSSLIIGPCTVMVQVESDIICNLSIYVNNEQILTKTGIIGTQLIQQKYTKMCFGMRRISATVTDANNQEHTNAVSVFIFCCGRLFRP